MGLLRLLLTLEVVIVHAGIGSIVGGRLAVQIFFLISGYVISLVLNADGRYRGPAEFYAARFFKIFPEYLLVAGATLVIMLLIGGPWLASFTGAYSGPAAGLLAVSNLFIVGQDWTNFLEGGHYGLVLPQMWAVGLELCFYAIAPFVVRRPGLMVAILIASVALRAALIYDGMGLREPWTYRFFPTELAIFMLGALTERAASVWRWSIKPELGTASVIMLMALAPFVPVSPIVKGVAVLAMIALAMPALVAFDARWKWSRAVGDCCYPLFLVHVTVICILASTQMRTVPFAALPLSILAAIALRVWVGRPLDQKRKAWSVALIDASRRRSPSIGNHFLPEVIAARVGEVDRRQRENA